MQSIFKKSTLARIGLFCCLLAVSCKKEAVLEKTEKKPTLSDVKMNITSGPLTFPGLDLYYSQNGPPYVLVQCNYTGPASQLTVKLSYNGHDDYGYMFTTGGACSQYFQLNDTHIGSQRYSVTVTISDGAGNSIGTSVSVNPPIGPGGEPLVGALSEMNGNIRKTEFFGTPRYFFLFDWYNLPFNALSSNEMVYVAIKFYNGLGEPVGTVTGSQAISHQPTLEIDIPQSIVSQAVYMKMLAGSDWDQINPFDYNERWENLQYLRNISWSFDLNGYNPDFRNVTVPVN